MYWEALGRANRNIKRTPFHKGIAAQLPEAYKRFWAEWTAVPSPVHYKPKEGRWTTDEYGVVKPIQNIPIPLKFPDEIHDGLWGGEAVIMGFKQEGNKYTRRVGQWWIPTLRESVLFSEVLKKYMKVIVTDRMIRLVHKHEGFDHYLLNTPACDIKSWLGLNLKRRILLNIRDGIYPYDGEDLEYIKKIYEPYLSKYDPEYIEWYGLRLEDAKKKLRLQLVQEVRPLKEQYRQNLLEELRGGSVILEPPTEEKETLLSKPMRLIQKVKSKVL